MITREFVPLVIISSRRHSFSLIKVLRYTYTICHIHSNDFSKVPVNHVTKSGKSSIVFEIGPDIVIDAAFAADDRGSARQVRLFLSRRRRRYTSSSCFVGRRGGRGKSRRSGKGIFAHSGEYERGVRCKLRGEFYSCKNRELPKEQLHHFVKP